MARPPDPADPGEPIAPPDAAVDDDEEEGAGHLLRWHRTFVDDRPAVYGVAGDADGLPLVFVHGWGLGHHAYKRAIKRLAAMGVRAYAPALPGFGGTADLPARRFSIPGYADWLERFLHRMGVDEPAVVVGHSFGGGVAIQLAHDHPGAVRSLVLVNSIGGSAWKGRGGGLRSMAERPLWDWGLHFPSDILPFGQLTRVLPVVLEDLVPNVVRNPRAVWRVAQLARRADLTEELEELKRRRLPVVVLWGADDRIIPRESFDELCRAIGAEGEVVDGSHSWLLADPDAFGEILTNSVEVAQLARRMERDDQQRGRRPRRRRGLLGLGRARPSELANLPSARPRDEADPA